MKTEIDRLKQVIRDLRAIRKGYKHDVFILNAKADGIDASINVVESALSSAEREARKMQTSAIPCVR